MSDLFDFEEKKDINNSLKPLPDRLRPKSVKEIFGQDHITGENGPINTIIKNIVANKISKLSNDASSSSLKSSTCLNIP